MSASKHQQKSKGKIPSPTGPSGGRIVAGSLPRDDGITFSFKYLHRNPPVSQEFPDGYWSELLRCFREYCGRNKGEIVGNRNPSLRAHGLDWDDSKVTDGFSHLPPHLRDCNGFQLSVKKDTFGRVIGLLLGSVFYVCWLDPKHETTGRTK